MTGVAKDRSTIMSVVEKRVFLKNVRNQTQLIPLLSLNYFQRGPRPLVSLLTRAGAPAKVTLGQAK